jgi:hypothetical protein
MQVTMRVLRNRGELFKPQCGSAHWQMNDCDEPEPNTFSYQWKPNASTSQVAVSEGYMPEIHCWVINPKVGILDCSTGYVHEDALRLGMRWELPPLPKYISGGLRGDGYLYEPSVEATHFALACLKRGIEGKEGLPRLPAWASQ